MGELIDIKSVPGQKSDRWTCNCRERVMIRMTICYLRITEREMLKMMLVLCDKTSDPMQVEEASKTLSILKSMLDQHEIEVRKLRYSLSMLE